MNTAKFSYYKGGITSIIPTKSIDLSELHALIKSKVFFQIINEYRSQANDSIKRKLDYITPAGIFTKRNNDSIVEFSGLIMLDFDDIENIVELKNSLINAQYSPCFMYISPGGRGLKVIYQIDLEEDTYHEYNEMLFQYVKMVSGSEADIKCKDISRASFLSYDPEVYYNEDASVLKGSFIADVRKITYEQSALINSGNILDLHLKNEQESRCNSDIDIMIKCMEKEQTFQAGNRNNFILHLAASLNRIGVPKDAATRILCDKYGQPDFTVKEISRTINSAYKNKQYHNIAPLKQSPDKAFANIQEAPPIFPTTGLPETILKFSENISETYGVPVEFPIVSSLAAFSATLKKKVKLTDNKFTNYPQIWAMIVAPSGVGKSEQLEIAFRPLKEIDRRNYDNYRLEMAKWKYDCITAKKAKEPEPEKPILKQLLVDDITPESLYQTLYYNQGAASLCRDELSGWFHDFGRYSKNGEVARYLSIFNNSQFSISRKSEEPLLIHNPFLSICGTIQPEVLLNVLNENDFKENGFASRFLYLCPDNLKRQYYTEIELDRLLYDRFSNLIMKTFDWNFDNDYVLGREALSNYILFSNEITDMINDTNNSFLKSGYAKLPIHVLRISLIIQIIEDIQNNRMQYEISEKVMDCAIQCCRYFAHSFRIVSNSFKAETALSKKTVAKYLIDEIGHSQNKVAEILKVSQQYINKISFGCRL